jgi:hypothetical protein
VQTNVVVFSVSGMDDASFIDACAKRGLRIAPISAGRIRAVFYHQISDDDAATAAEIVLDVLA